MSSLISDQTFLNTRKHNTWYLFSLSDEGFQNKSSCQ